MKKKQEKPHLPRPFEIETVTIPVPSGDSDRHLYEAKLLLTIPAGHSMSDVYGAIIAWILRGSHGKAEVLAEYGGGLKNKTLSSSAGRKAFRGSGVICTAFDNKPLPKNDTRMLVMREKTSKKKTGAPKHVSETERTA